MNVFLSANKPAFYLKIFPFKKHSMQELPRIKKISIAIQFLGTYIKSHI